MASIQRQTYLSFDPDDIDEVEAFLNEFDDLDGHALRRPLEALEEDIVKGADKHEVIHKMRERHLKDSVVTLLLLGPCTYTRQSVDLELLASLHNPGDAMADPRESTMPNGLLTVMLPSYSNQGFPDRLNANLRVPEETRTEPYARVIPYPESKDALAEAIEDAYAARETKRDLLNNTPHMYSEDRACIPNAPGEQFVTKE